MFAHGKGEHAFANFAVVLIYDKWLSIVDWFSDEYRLANFYKIGRLHLDFRSVSVHPSMFLLAYLNCSSQNILFSCIWFQVIIWFPCACMVLTAGPSWPTWEQRSMVVATEGDQLLQQPQQSLKTLQLESKVKTTTQGWSHEEQVFCWCCRSQVADVLGGGRQILYNYLCTYHEKDNYNPNTNHHYFLICTYNYSCPSQQKAKETPLML